MLRMAGVNIARGEGQKKHAVGRCGAEQATGGAGATYALAQS